jgi:hypothetical protein
MFKTTLKTRRKTTNLNFRNSIFIEIVLNNANTNSTIKIIDKKIRLLIKKVEIVRRIKKTIFEIGFNSCRNEVPGI